MSHFYFRMVDNEKIGIVGRNGAGKTSLLKLINGEIKLDYNDDNTMGEISKSKDFNCGYLRQQLAGYDNDKGKTVLNYLMEAFSKLIDMEKKIEKLTNDIAGEYDENMAIELNKLIDSYNLLGGNTYIKELKTGFKKFGFNILDLDKSMDEFSGGQSTKISLLKLLLSKPDVLMLDEPTNHLDIEAIEWMENYLKKYKKNIIVVSHDRMFLDNICQVIYDVENKLTIRYEGNYSDFVEQKEINYQLQLANYNKNLKEIERLTKLTERFRYKATKASMVQSKDKTIEKLEEKTFKPAEADTKSFHVKIVPNKVGGIEVFRCEKLGIGYDNEITKVSLIIRRRDRLAIIGANGTGKSTFIKTIVGEIEKKSGDFSFGHEIEYEYFDQKIAENNSTKTLFEDFSDEFPTYTNTEIRNRLGRFLFGEEDINKRVCDLSGGEKVRLCLSKIFERKPNLLILDEPTNHLDILGKESLEQILDSYDGTVILVSHDRYFVKKMSNKILYFEKISDENHSTKDLKSNVHFFEFGYEDYEKYIKDKEKLEEENFELLDDRPLIIQNNKTNYELNKQKNKNEKKKQKLEKEISDIEEKINKLKEELNNVDIQSDFIKLGDLQKTIEENEALLDSKYEDWGSL